TPVTCTVGGVRSIFTVTTLLGALVLPAMSATVWAVELTAVPSVLSTWTAGQAPAARPEPPAASVQVKCTVTGPPYQPLPLGWLVAAAVTVGAVVSIFTVRLWGVLLPAASVIVQLMTCEPSPVSCG